MRDQQSNISSIKNKNLSVQESDQTTVVSNDERLNLKLRYLEAEIETLKEVLNTLVGSDQLSDVLVNTVTISPGDDFIGTNWHPAEVSNSGIELRWTGPGTLATFKLPLLRSENLKAVFRTFTQKNSLHNIDKLSIFVDGNEITPLFKDEERIEFIIPAKKYVFSFTEIGILIEKTYQVKDAKGNVVDKRWLGCAFRGLSISI